MRRLIFGLVAVASTVVSTAAFGLMDDPINTRKQLMQSNGASMGTAQAMIKGEIPFDARIAMAALQNFEAVGYSFGDYFPPGSDQGETRASPKIWAEMAEFQQYITDFREKSAGAIAAKPATLEDFQTALGPIGQNCQTCHQEFREEQ